MHGSSTGVIGLAAKGKSEPGLAYNRADRGNTQAFRFEHRSLFDVNLNKADCFGRQCCLADAARIETEGEHGCLDGRPLEILQREQVRIEAPRYRAAAHERHAK